MPWGPLWWSRDAEGHPMDTLGSRGSFLLILGCLWGVSWVHFGDIFVDSLLIWSAKMGDGFQVHIFSYPGMEMMPGCRGCMCYNHHKNKSFGHISLFPRIHEFSVSRDGVRCHLMTFGDLGHTFSDIWEYGEQAWDLKVFQVFPGETQILGPSQVEGNRATPAGQ